MDKFLTIRIDNPKTVKDAQNNDVKVLFSLCVPYGVPYALAEEALKEFGQELASMSQLDASKQQESTAASDQSIQEIKE